jgi:hypothetical protein
LAHAADRASGLFERLARGTSGIGSDERTASIRADFAELAVACRFAALFAEKAGDTVGPQWTDGLRQAASDFASNWKVRYKPSGLRDILEALERAARA